MSSELLPSCCCGDFERLRDESLVLHIFSFVGADLRNLFRLRAVCKPWRDAVLSVRFLKFYKPSPWCALRVRTQVPDGIGLIPKQYTDDILLENRDLRMQLENHVELWIPGEECEYSVPKKCRLPLGPPGSCFVGMCSSGGLVCGWLSLADLNSSPLLVVGNPLTNTWKTLPPAPGLARAYLFDTSHQTCISMETTRAGEEDQGDASWYRIVVLSKQSPGAVLVAEFDSRTGAWESGPPLGGLELALCDPPFTASVIFLHRFRGGRVGYDPETKTWSGLFGLELMNAHPETDAGSEWEGWSQVWSHVFRYNGEYHLVAELENSRVKKPLGFSIWKLTRDVYEGWKLVSRVLWEELGCRRGTRDIMVKRKVEVVGDMVVVSGLYNKHSYGAFRPVAFDMVSSRWCAALGAPDAECCYTFLPSLTAQP